MTFARYSSMLRSCSGKGRHAVFLDLVNLILHQRDERRHHDRQAVEDHSRDLVAEGLAPARGMTTKASCFSRIWAMIFSEAARTSRSQRPLSGWIAHDSWGDSLNELGVVLGTAKKSLCSAVLIAHLLTKYPPLFLGPEKTISPCSLNFFIQRSMVFEGTFTAAAISTTLLAGFFRIYSKSWLIPSFTPPFIPHLFPH